MKIGNDLKFSTNFKGINFSKVPEKLAKEIKTNAVIKNAAKYYSLDFSVHKIMGKEKILCLMSKPNTDSFLGLLFTPPRMIIQKYHWFDFDDIHKLNETPDFFEKKLGPKKNYSIFERLAAIYDAMKNLFKMTK